MASLLEPEIDGQIPPQTTSRFPAAVTPQTDERETVQFDLTVHLAITFGTKPETTVRVATRVIAQIAPETGSRMTSRLAFRTTPGTVLGTVLTVVPGMSF